jgi:thiol-disulfide isomerase/thioredoxin
MRHLKILSEAFILFSFCLAVADSTSQRGPVQGPAAPESPPTFELDKAGRRSHIDFALKLGPISEVNMQFSQFSNRNLMIFFFSAMCPHCQNSFPHVQKLADELNLKGFKTIAIATQSNTEDDIRGFIRDYKVHIPVFRDDEFRTFGTNYGNKFVPLVLIVNKRGEYIRYANFNAEQTPEMIKNEAALLARK